MVDVLWVDVYDGVIFFESVYYFGNGDFEVGFCLCIDWFKEIFG